MSEYNKDLVRAKVAQCFPGQEADEIIAILDLYGTEPYERERERVQIAILKLSEGSVERLHANVEAAKRDYRDVLAYAEYPEEMSRATWRISDQEEVRALRERDRRQYLDWLNG